MAGYVRTIQWRLLDTVTSMQPFSPAVSRGNESHITNSPSASPLIVVRDHLRVPVGASRSYSDYLCGYRILRVSTIRERRPATIRRNTVSAGICWFTNQYAGIYPHNYIIEVHWFSVAISLVLRPSWKAEKGSGVLSNISCHMGWDLRTQNVTNGIFTFRVQIFRWVWLLHAMVY